VTSSHASDRMFRLQPLAGANALTQMNLPAFPPIVKSIVFISHIGTAYKTTFRTCYTSDSTPFSRLSLGTGN
jgi:hypothetical protein